MRTVIRGRGSLLDHVNQTGTRTQKRARPPTVWTACSTAHMEESTTRTAKKKKCSYNKDWEIIYPLVKPPVQGLGESGKVLCEVCLSHFSVSHGGEYVVKRQTMRDTKNVIILCIAYCLILYPVVPLVDVVQ